MLNKKEVVTLTNEQELELALSKALRGNVTEEVLEESREQHRQDY